MYEPCPSEYGRLKNYDGITELCVGEIKKERHINERGDAGEMQKGKFYLSLRHLFPAKKRKKMFLK